MEKNWVKIFKTDQLYEANVMEALLKENDVVVFRINKQDSAYGPLIPGFIELYTTAEQVEKAQSIINQ